MKKNKLTIDLGNLHLSEKDKLKLLDAVHKTVHAKVKTQSPVLPSPVVTKATPAKAAASSGATITATFRNVNPGLSQLTATHNGVEKTITQSGTLDFDNVQKGEIIMMQGKSLGSAEITIDREADPQEKKFDPGVIFFNFFILQ